jgi:4-hydroxy-tetrahydrodipicolinate synthase
MPLPYNSERSETGEIVMVKPASLSVHVISITPFDHHGEVDELGLRQHLRRMAAAGIGVYLGGGGSGEGYVLEPHEVDRILEIGVEELHGKVPVRSMGVEPRSAQEAVRLGRRAADIGVDAVQVYSLDMGHGRKPRPDEHRRYFSEVLSALSIPSYIASHHYSGQLLDIELVDHLIDEFPLLAGINCTTTDTRHLVELASMVTGRIELHVGGPEQALNALALGGNGFLISEANLAPNVCRTVVERWGAGDLEGASRAYQLVLEMFVAFQQRGGISGTKSVMSALGLPSGQPRPPRLAVPDEWTQAMLATLRNLDLARWEDWELADVL